MHGVGVHNPGHLALASAHVRRRDVPLRAHQHADLGGITTGEILQLPDRERLRITEDPPLGSPIRDANHRAFPGHPHRQGADFIKRHAWMITNPALGRAERGVMVDAIAGEDTDRAIVHCHGKVNGEFALGGA